MLLICYNTPNLFSAIYSEINTVSNINKTLLQNISGNYKFKFPLITVTINRKKNLKMII